VEEAVHVPFPAVDRLNVVRPPPTGASMMDKRRVMTPSKHDACEVTGGSARVALGNIRSLSQQLLQRSDLW
jgi:hypothetical protein